MFNMNHGGDKNAADGLNNNSSEFSILLDFHHHVNTMIAMVRPKDVSMDNTVYSYQVANASISVKGNGPVRDAEQPGWFTKMVNWVF